MYKLIQRLFARMGRPAQLVSGEKSERVQVIVQPRRAVALQNMQRLFTPLGQVKQEGFVCYFPAEARVFTGDRLVVQGRSYRVCTVEPMMAGKDRALYQWSLCREEGGADQ